MIAAIPFGGYVKMLDEREGPVEAHEAARAFNRQSVWRRFAIVVAGPVANFLFAIAVYAGLFMYGLPEARPVVGAPIEGSVAAAAGLRAGDTVRAVDGEAITTWQELRWRVLQSALQRQSLRLEVLDERGHVRDTTLDLRAFPTDDVQSDALERVGLRLYRPPLEPDRKSTRLNSSHSQSSYAVFCLKKKNYVARTAARVVPHVAQPRI